MVWTAVVLWCGKQMEKLPHYHFSWIVSFQKQRYQLSIEGGSSRSHYVEESFWKRLWTCRLTDYWWWWFLSVWKFLSYFSAEHILQVFREICGLKKILVGQVFVIGKGGVLLWRKWNVGLWVDEIMYIEIWFWNVMENWDVRDRLGGKITLR